MKRCWAQQGGLHSSFPFLIRPVPGCCLQDPVPAQSTALGLELLRQLTSEQLQVTVKVSISAKTGLSCSTGPAGDFGACLALRKLTGCRHQQGPLASLGLWRGGGREASCGHPGKKHWQSLRSLGSRLLCNKRYGRSHKTTSRKKKRWKERTKSKKLPLSSRQAVWHIHAQTHTHRDRGEKITQLLLLLLL